MVKSPARINEYQQARDWLEHELWPQLSPNGNDALPHDRLLLVPGNHDVDWAKIKAGARDAYQAILQAKTQDAVTERLEDRATRDLLLKRHAAYLKFYSDWLDQRQILPWWQRTLDIRGQRLHVAGLDSAWLAAGDDDSRLVLGPVSQTRAVARMQRSELRVAVAPNEPCRDRPCRPRRNGSSRYPIRHP